MTFRQTVALADVPALPNGTDPTNASIPINLAGTDYLASRTALFNGLDVTAATVLSSLPTTGNLLFLTAANAIALLPVGLLPTGGTVSAPVNTAIPVISGTAQVGQTLSASQGTWSNSPTSYAYVWKRAGTAISGATNATYSPISADVGNTLTVTVTATNSGGSASATSNATSSVIAAAAGAPSNTAVPTITGTAQVGQTLTSSQGTWTNSPTGYTYQWLRAGAAISGATSSTYVPVTADIGNALTVTVTATNGSGSASATSAATSAVIAAGGGSYPTLNFTSGPTYNTTSPKFGSAAAAGALVATATGINLGAGNSNFCIEVWTKGQSGGSSDASNAYFGLSDGTNFSGSAMSFDRWASSKAIGDVAGTSVDAVYNGAYHYITCDNSGSTINTSSGGTYQSYYNGAFTGGTNCTFMMKIPAGLEIDAIKISKVSKFPINVSPPIPTAAPTRDGDTVVIWQLDGNGTGS